MSLILGRGNVAPSASGADQILMIQRNEDAAVINIGRLSMINAGTVTILRPDGNIAKMVSVAADRTLVTVEVGKAAAFAVGDFVITRERDKEAKVQSDEYTKYQITAINGDVITLDSALPAYSECILIGYGTEADAHNEDYVSVAAANEVTANGEMGYFISDMNMPMLIFKPSAVAITGGNFFVTQN